MTEQRDHLPGKPSGSVLDSTHAAEGFAMFRISISGEEVGWVLMYLRSPAGGGRERRDNATINTWPMITMGMRSSRRSTAAHFQEIAR